MTVRVLAVDLSAGQAAVARDSGAEVVSVIGLRPARGHLTGDGEPFDVVLAEHTGANLWSLLALFMDLPSGTSVVLIADEHPSMLPVLLTDTPGLRLVAPDGHRELRAALLEARGSSARCLTHA